MRSRFVTAAVLPGAQGGTTSSQSMGTQGNTSAQGTAGTSMSNTQGNMSSQGSMNSSNTGAQANPVRHHRYRQQAEAPADRRADAAERPVTECLNEAAANHQALNACKR
jgi:hypothetical protein